MYRTILLLLFVAGTFVSCNQQSPSHHFKNANAKYNLQNYAGAIDDLNRALELNKNYKEAYYLRALSFTKMDDPENALNDFNQAISLDPSFADAYLNRAFYAKTRLGDFQGAIEDYNTYLKLDENGNRAYALNNRGFAWYKSGNYQEALKDIDESIRLNSENPYAFRNRALINLATDSTDLACRDLLIADSLGFAIDYGQEVEELIRQHCN